MQKINIKKILLTAWFFGFFFLANVAQAVDPVVIRASGPGGDYTLLEGIPGVFAPRSSVTIQEYAAGIYKFGIMTVGIVAAFMIIVGGFMYMTSAGNTSSAGKAKGIISDALLGLVVAIGAYLFLYVINPDLTNLSKSFEAVSLRNYELGPGQYSVEGTGKCSPIAEGVCSEANLKNWLSIKGYASQVNPDIWAKQASSICNKESKGRVDAASTGVDYCKGSGQEEVVSFGLFQINLTWHNVAGKNCPDAFQGRYSGKSSILKCKVKDRSLYNNCVQLAKTASHNLDEMWATYKSGKNGVKYSWNQWGANTSHCGFGPGGGK